MGTFTAQLSVLFRWILASTVQVGILILLILAIKGLTRKRLGVRWHYWLWLLLLVRMVVPWGPQSSVSLYHVIRQIKDSMIWKYGEYAAGSNRPAVIAEPELVASPEQVLPETNGQETRRLEEAKEKVAVQVHVARRNRPPALRVPRRPERPKQAHTRLASVRVLNLLGLVWFFVALALAVIGLVSNMKFWKIIKSQRPLTEGKILELFEDCKEQMGIQTIIGIVVTDKVESPALFGVIRPRLLLPKGAIEKLNSDELRYVFLHELAHHKRHDIYLGWVMVLLQVLHWFNPLVWLAFARMRADRELACDALVVCTAGNGRDSEQYGQTIVNLFKGFSEKSYVPGIAGILENKAQLKRRIVMIAGFREDSYRFSILAVVLLLVLGIVGLTNAKERILVSATRGNLVKVFGTPLRYQREDKQFDGVDDYANVRNLHLTTIERIDAAMDREWAASERIDRILESGEPGDLSRSDIEKAKREILLAMYYEKASAEALAQSAVEVEEALKRLGFKIEDSAIVKNNPQDSKPAGKRSEMRNMAVKTDQELTREEHKRTK